MDLIISHNPEETFAAARALAQELNAGAVLGLVGDLGAGKTQFVKGLAEGLGFCGAVTSPTFTLVHEYMGGRFPLFHFDFYRLGNASDRERIGFDDYLDAGGVLVIEWASRFPEWLPANTRWLKFTTQLGGERWVEQCQAPLANRGASGKESKPREGTH